MRPIKSGGRLYVCKQDITYKILMELVARGCLLIGINCETGLILPDGEGDGQRTIQLIALKSEERTIVHSRWESCLSGNSSDGLLFSSGMCILIGFADDESIYRWTDREKKQLLAEMLTIGIEACF